MTNFNWILLSQLKCNFWHFLLIFPKSTINFVIIKWQQKSFLLVTFCGVGPQSTRNVRNSAFSKIEIQIFRENDACAKVFVVIFEICTKFYHRKVSQILHTQWNKCGLASQSLLLDYWFLEFTTHIWKISALFEKD